MQTMGAEDAKEAVARQGELDLVPLPGEAVAVPEGTGQAPQPDGAAPAPERRDGPPEEGTEAEDPPTPAGPDGDRPSEWL